MNGNLGMGTTSLGILFFGAGLAATAAGTPRAHLDWEPPDTGPLSAVQNLFLDAAVTASGHWSNQVPHFAVDGHNDSPGAHWACENLPVWLTVDMGRARRLNAIRLWTYWNGRRWYQYVIEGSRDGRHWQMLADRRANRTPAGSTGETFMFPETTVRYVRTTITGNSAGKKPGGHIVEIQGFRLNATALRSEQARLQSWKKVEPGLHGRFGSPDVRYARNAAPEQGAEPGWQVAAWRGERVNAQLLLWTADGATQVRVRPPVLRSSRRGPLEPNVASCRFVRYVRAGSALVPDVLDPKPRLDMAPETVRPVWVTVNVPKDAAPGTYHGEIAVVSADRDPLVFPVSIQVLAMVLPPARDWAFHLDLWQNPFAVARWHRVEPWSAEHFQLLAPLLKRLADAGQKVLTTSIVWQPWGGQTFDPFDSMIDWVRRPDGTFGYEFDVFDRYVEFAATCGYAKARIHCYSMAPWSSRVRYRDAATGDYHFIHAVPGEPAYAKLWGPFLKAFAAHLKKKGWLERTAIAMDERPLPIMRKTAELIRSAAPGLGIALAGSNEKAFADMVDDWCAFLRPGLGNSILSQRRERGRPTTFYVCCGPARPNTFTNSPPAESAWLGLYAAAHGYDGFLRWAYNSWVENPLWNTDYVRWPPGDCFLVYPGNRSSIRFERLREGIQEFEKIRVLRAAATKRPNPKLQAALSQLDKALKQLTVGQGAGPPAAGQVRAVEQAVLDAARALPATKKK